MGEKTIKISFAVDETSARKAKTLIDDLTRSVDRLVQSTSRVGAAMGGMGGGNVAGGSSVTMRSGRMPMGGASHMAASGGIVASVLGVQSPTALRGLVSGTQSAFQNVSASVKTFVDKATADISKLQKAVDSLGKSFGSISMPTGGMGGGGGGAGGGGAPSAGGNAPAPARGTGGGPGPTGGGGGGGHGGGGSIFGKGGINGYIGSHVTNFASNVGLPGPVANGLGRLAGGVGLVGGAAIAALGAYEFGAASFEKQRAQQVAFTLDQPIKNQSRRAAVASNFNELNSAVQNRDVMKQHAFRQTMNNKEIMGSINNVTLQREQLEAGFNRISLTGMGKNALEKMKGWAGNTFGDFASYVSGQDLSPAEKSTMLEMARENAFRDMPAQQAAKFKSAWASQEALQDPTNSMMVNRIAGGAMSRVKTMRSMGMSAGTRKRKDGSEVFSYEDQEQKLMRGGWDFGDQAAGHQQLLGIGSGYSSQIGAIGLVSAGIGGLTNAAQLVHAGGSMAGSNKAGGSMYRAAQRSIGSGGLDVAVGRELFGNVASHAASTGQFGGSIAAEQYASSTAGLIAGGDSIPLDVGGQQRRASMIQSGMSAFGGFTGGGKAPLYQATSNMGAIAAAGGYGAKSEAIRSMDPALLKTIAAGGDVPPWAAALGVGKEEATKFLQYQAKVGLFEVRDSSLSGTAATTMAKVREAEKNGGSFLSVVDAEMGALKQGKKESKRAFQGRQAAVQTRIATDLGAAMFASKLVADPETGAGIFMGQIAGRNLKGKGVGAAGPKGAEAIYLNDQAALVKDESERVKAVNDITADHVGSGGSLAARKGAAAGVRAAARGQDGSIESSAQDAASALAAFAATVKNSKVAQSPITKTTGGGKK